MGTPAALVIATHPQQCRALVHCLEDLGVKPALAFTLEEARQVLCGLDGLAFVCCAHTLLDGSYKDILAETQSRALPVVLVGHADESREPEAEREQGVHAHLAFPFQRADAEKVLLQVLKASSAA